MTVYTLTITVDGQALSAEAELLAVDVRRSLNRLPAATLLFRDGDIAERKFPLSDAATFKPGALVKVEARWEDQSGSQAKLFEGLVVRHGIEAGQQGSVLRIELRDKAIALTRPRRSRHFSDKTDADAIKAIVGQAGLSIDMPSTQATHRSLVQYDCSDWDWIVTRLEALGLVLAVDDGKLLVQAPELGSSAARTLKWGIDPLVDFQFDCDASGQDPDFAVEQWDLAKQAVQVAKGAPPPAPGQGSLRPKAAAQALGFKSATLRHLVPMVPEEAKQWADSQALRGQMALLRGRLSLDGDGKLKLLQTLALEGFGKRFSGQALVTGLAHRLDANGWRTDLQFGLADAPHHRRQDLAPAAAGGLLPAVSGLQLAVVEKVDADPDGEHRVQIKLPALGSEAAALWARLASPDAGKARGWVFRPEPGDEVVVGFFNDDPRQPVVLGSLFSGKQAPPEAVFDDSANNTKRGIVTRQGLSLCFLDGDKPKIELKTPGGASLVLDDEAKAVVLTDHHGNTVRLSKDGIELVSKKDLVLEAKSGKLGATATGIDLN